MIEPTAILALLNQPNTAVCRISDSPTEGIGIFSDPETVLETNDFGQIPDLIRRIERERENGAYVAGFLGYEAAAAFDPANRTRSPERFPLLRFGIYRKAPICIDKLPPPSVKTFPEIGFKPEITETEYRTAIDILKRYIHDGDIYQANFTFRCHGPGISDPANRFLAICRSHPVPYAAYVHAGTFQVLSVSPELFCRREGDALYSLPMKGTAKRGEWSALDRNIAEQLGNDPKNRAENVMIADMVRSDIGKIAVIGSVRTDPLFHVETYRTVHQMVTGVHGRIVPGIGLLEILSALFPAASITGAPKIRAMEIIRELERSPREIYTGAIGCILPNGDFQFNVAIRTILCDENRSELGIGSGIVADSDADSEWQECILKSRFVSHFEPCFDILETILWSRDNAFAELEAHLERARASQRHFQRPWNETRIRETLESFIPPETCDFARVRLLVDENGKPRIETYPLPHAGWGKQRLKIRIAKTKTRTDDPFLYHKTTRRELYDTQYREALKDGFDEIIFLNSEGFVTEGAITNIFVRTNGGWKTPPIRSGLLDGIWRKHQIKKLNAQETPTTIDDLRNAEMILIGNSVRNTGIVGELQIENDIFVFHMPAK